MIKKLFKRLRSQKLLSMLSSVSGALLATLTFAILARGLSKEDFGVFGVYLTITTLADMMRNGLTGRPLIKFYSEAQSDEERDEILGSGWYQGAQVSLLIAGLGSLILGLIYAWQPSEEFKLYLLFFAPFMLLTLPMNLGTWALNARLRFDQMIWIRMSMQGAYILGALYLYWQEGGIVMALGVYLLANTLSSVVSLLMKWDGWPLLSYAMKERRLAIWRFGKFSMGTLLGGNLLRSSDIFILRIFLGPEAVALYQVPQRLVSLAEIPLRALVSFSFPALAANKKQAGSDAFRTEFEKSAGFAFLLILPFALASFIFAEPLVVLFGGEAYQEAAIILRWFSVYMAIISIDRYGGMALDILDRPNINMYKVFLMLIVNVVGDLIAVQVSKEVSWVAFVSIFTFSSGIVFGFYYLRDSLPFRAGKWLISGFQEGLAIVKKLVRK